MNTHDIIRIWSTHLLVNAQAPPVSQENNFAINSSEESMRTTSVNSQLKVSNKGKSFWYTTCHASQWASYYGGPSKLQ